MKKCPYCGHQNEDSLSLCSICQTELSPTPAPACDPQLTDPTLALVTVASFRSLEEAGMLKARLESAGIEACIPEEFSPHIFWTMTPTPLEAVTVRVAAKDFEAAKQVITGGA
jgi:hypothetical protein